MVNLAKKFVEDYEAGRLAYGYGIPRDEMLNEAQRLGWDEVDNGGVKARPTAQEFGRLLDTYRSAIQYGIDDHIEAAGFALDEWVEHALGVTVAPAPAPLTMPEFRDTCTDPDNCRRCGHGTPTWDQANHEHAGIPIGPQKTKPKGGVDGPDGEEQG